jgi:hypothetical protein
LGLLGAVWGAAGRLRGSELVNGVIARAIV